jgi:hypothetical protein
MTSGVQTTSEVVILSTKDRMVAMRLGALDAARITPPDVAATTCGLAGARLTPGVDEAAG